MGIMKKINRKGKEYNIAKGIAIKDLIQACYKSTITTKIVQILKDMDQEHDFNDIVDFISIEYGLANLKNEEFITLLSSVVFEDENGAIRINPLNLENLGKYVMDIPNEELLEIASKYNKRENNAKNVMIGHQIFASAITGKNMEYSPEGSDE